MVITKKFPRFRTRLEYLKIKKVQPSDEGLYACIAHNSFGVTRQEIRLVVRGKGKKIDSTSIINFEIARNSSLSKVFRKQSKIGRDRAFEESNTRKDPLCTFLISARSENTVFLLSYVFLSVHAVCIVSVSPLRRNSFVQLVCWSIGWSISRLSFNKLLF